MAKKKPVFAQKLTELREQSGLTPHALADLAKVDSSFYYRLEGGSGKPGWSTVQALADALGVSTDAFREPGRKLEEEENPEKLV